MRMSPEQQQVFYSERVAKVQAGIDEGKTAGEACKAANIASSQYYKAKDFLAGKKPVKAKKQKKVVKGEKQKGKATFFAIHLGLFDMNTCSFYDENGKPKRKVVIQGDALAVLELEAAIQAVQKSKLTQAPI